MKREFRPIKTKQDLLSYIKANKLATITNDYSLTINFGYLSLIIDSDGLMFSDIGFNRSKFHQVEQIDGGWFGSNEQIFVQFISKEDCKEIYDEYFLNYQHNCKKERKEFLSVLKKIGLTENDFFLLKKEFLTD